MALSPWFVSFTTENETVEIVPKVKRAAVFLMGGKIGPFEPSMAVRVPLWVAVMMRQRHLCRIVCPPWMTVESFQKIKVSRRSLVSISFIFLPVNVNSTSFYIYLSIGLTVFTDQLSRILCLDHSLQIRMCVRIGHSWERAIF